MSSTVSSLGRELVRPLRTVTRVDHSVAGSRAVLAGECMQAGIAVANGFVITARAYEYWLLQAAKVEGTVLKDLMQVPLPPIVMAALRGIDQVWDGLSLTLKLSPLAQEPFASASILDFSLVITSLEALPQSLLLSFAWTLRRARLRSSEQAGKDGIAVLFQLTQKADTIGVACSADPYTGDREGVIVRAERVDVERQAGVRTSIPDEWWVSEERTIWRQASAAVLEFAKVQQMAALARAVEQVAEQPVSVQFTMLADQWTLSSIDALILPPTSCAERFKDTTDLQGYWQRAEDFGSPLSPAMRWWLEASNQAARQVMKESGLLYGLAEFRLVHGWVYERPLLGALPAAEIPSTKGLTGRFTKLPAQWQERSEQMVSAFMQSDIAQADRKWREEWEPSVREQMDAWQNIVHETLTDEQLYDHALAVQQLAQEGLTIHWRIESQFSAVVGSLLELCRTLLGWNEAQATALLIGLPGMVSEADQHLEELVRVARGKRDLLDRLKVPKRISLLWLAEIDTGFASVFYDYLYRYGDFSLEREVRTPTLAECPAYLLQVVRERQKGRFTLRARQMEADTLRNKWLELARRQLDKGRKRDREQFEEAYQRACEVYPLRLATERLLQGKPLSHWRFTLLEIGARLVKRKQLGAVDDVFWLEASEVLMALQQEAGDLWAIVAERKELYSQELKQHPSVIRGTERQFTPPVPLSLLPPEGQTLQRTIHQYGTACDNSQATVDNKEAGATGVRGVGVALGTYSGVARIVRSGNDLARLRQGEVMVCLQPLAQWSSWYAVAGAVVADHGDYLSVGSMLAREYGLAAVVNTISDMS